MHVIRAAMTEPGPSELSSCSPNNPINPIKPEGDMYDPVHPPAWIWLLLDKALESRAPGDSPGE